MASSVVDAKPIYFEELKDVKDIDIELHFGIFFDGTNNQEVQVMIGKQYRRKEIISTLQKDINSGKLTSSQLERLEKNGIVKRTDISKKDYQSLAIADSLSRNPMSQTLTNGILQDDKGYHEYKVVANEENMLKLSGDKSFWGQKNGESRGILSQTNIDYLYFGYEKDDYVMEKHIKDKVDKGMFIYSESDINDRHEEEDNYIRKTSDTMQGQDSIYKTKELNKVDKHRPQEAAYTNVAILEAFFNTRKENNKYFIPLYVEGSGTSAVLDTNFYTRNVEDTLEGQAFAKGEQGVLGKLTKMVNQVRQYALAPRGAKSVKIYYYVYGFSRGATTARIFNYVVNCELNEKKLKSSLSESTKNTLKEFIGRKSMLAGMSSKSKDKFTEIQVKFLGLFDTVSSIGLNVAVREHYQNIREYHLYETNKAEYTLQISAIDEVRENFALVDIDTSLSDGKGLELFIPGCHTDIGGGVTIGMTEHSFAYNGKSLWTSGIENQSKLKWIELCPENLEKSLLSLGWIEGSSKPGDKDYQYDSTYYTTGRTMIGYREVTLARRVSPGYSNMPLELMRAQSLSKGESKLFKTIQGSSYSMPDTLTSMFGTIKGKLGSTGKRLFCYPKQTQYAALRKKFITYSCEDGAVNPPSYATIKTDGKKYELQTRIIYEGLEKSNIDTAVENKSMLSLTKNVVDDNLKFMFHLNGEYVEVSYS